MKKYFLPFVMFVMFAVAYLIPEVPKAFAVTATPCTEQSTFCPLAPIPGLTEQTTSAVNSATLAGFFNNLYKYLIGLAAVFAVIEIIWGGLEISTKDSVSKQSDGRNRIQQALFGLVLVLSPVLVFTIINPSILNLEIGMEALNIGIPIGDAGNGTIQIGRICSSNDQCQTGFCDTGNTPPRCANTPDTDGNQCFPGPDTPQNMRCPEGFACESIDNKYRCTNGCNSQPYAEFVACNLEKLTKWCPTTSPDWDECKMDANANFAVCVNMDPQTACDYAKKGPTKVSDIR